MSSPGDGSSPNWRWGELAAVVSAIAAVIGLLLAVFGVPLVGGSPANRAIADGAGTPDASAPTASASPGTHASRSPSATGSPGTAPPAPSRSSLSPPSPIPPIPPMPKGWHRVSVADLTVSFALPNGWIQEVENGIQSTWHSPDDVHTMSVKRDTSYGSTPRAASAGQLAWYRDTAESSMADLAVTTHATRQNGRDALWLEIDYHWAGQSGPRKRVEVFVAGSAGHVYQLLLDTAAAPEELAEQRQMFATARDRLRIDTSRAS